MKTQTLLSSNLHAIKIDPANHIVEAITNIAGRKYEYYFHFHRCALSSHFCEFLIQFAPSRPSGTLIAFCNAFERLLGCFSVSGHETLNAESFSAYTDWLKRVESPHTLIHYAEGTRRAYGTFILKFMEWLVDVDVISLKDITTARLRHQRALRGSNARQVEQLRLKAVSPEDYTNLIRAIRLEYEECKKILGKSQQEQEEYDITFPLLPFSMLLGIKLAVRPVEFNHLTVGDLRGERLLLNPPNKRASEVWLPPSLMAALTLAQDWMLRYRDNSASDDPLLSYPLDAGPRASQLVRFDSILLRNSLSKFYKKYFDLIGPDGMPYLYAASQKDSLDLTPFSLPFSDFRSASITDVARHERNPTAVMRFARHEYFSTTLKFYISETHREWLTNVARHLAPSAELLRISLANKIAIPEEEVKAQASDATVPGGHCGQAAAGDHSCVRATDCRLCVNFRIHISKREFFVKEREDALQVAQSLQSEQGLIREAQNLREFAALNQAIVNRIDEHLAKR